MMNAPAAGRIPSATAPATRRVESDTVPPLGERGGQPRHRQRLPSHTTDSMSGYILTHCHYEPMLRVINK